MIKGTVHWHKGALYTPSGYLVVRCTWSEVLDALENADDPLTVILGPPR